MLPRYHKNVCPEDFSHVVLMGIFSIEVVLEPGKDAGGSSALCIETDAFI